MQQHSPVINFCTSLTTEANDVLSPVHDPMPVILHPDAYELWPEGASESGTC